MLATGGQHRRHAIPLRDEKHMRPATVDRIIDDSIRCSVTLDGNMARRHQSVPRNRFTRLEGSSCRSRRRPPNQATHHAGPAVLSGKRSSHRSRRKEPRGRLMRGPRQAAPKGGAIRPALRTMSTESRPIRSIARKRRRSGHCNQQSISSVGAPGFWEARVTC